MDQQTPSRNLSEIGHLFLSSVRDRHTGGTALPKRQPPGSRVAPQQQSQHEQEQSLSLPAAPRIEAGAIELTAEEIEGVRVGPTAAPSNADLRIPPVTAVIGAHLNGKQLDRVKEYARHLAAGGQRVGLIEVDASEFRLTCFDCAPHGDSTEADSPAGERFFDARAMGDALEELSWDLDQWLLVLPNLRTCEARALLRDVSRWVLLSTCDHDGVVGCYRTLKGLHADVRGTAELSLALLDARDDDEADRVYRKLAGVCEQFLGWQVEMEAAVRPAARVAEHLVMCSRATRDKAQLGAAPQWQVVAELIARANSRIDAPSAGFKRGAGPSGSEREPEESEPMARVKTAAEEAGETNAMAEAEMDKPMAAGELRPMGFAAMEPVMRVAMDSDDDRQESEIATVIDLPDAAGATAASILAAILRSQSEQMVECPVRPPMCPDARLAVTRERRIVLLGVARQGLGELRAIGRAFKWLVESQNLICMAMPQLAIDPSARPCLRLLVDHADLSADLLQPMLQSSTVTVQAYRRVRWGAKMGLMLDAA
jgi:hypothetical protein